MKPQQASTIDMVHDFWQTHINNEYYTDAARGSEAYFRDIEERRSTPHYHLPELFQSMDGRGQKLLEVGCGIGVDSIQLARRGYDVTAVDLTDSALAVARKFADHRGVSIELSPRERRRAPIRRRQLRRRVLVWCAPPHPGHQPVGVGGPPGAAARGGSPT